MKQKIEAKNKFESYIYNWRNQINNEQTSKVLSEADKSTIESTVKSAQEWLENNQTASKEEYDNKQKEYEKTFNEIATRLYSQMGNTTPPTEETGQTEQSGVDEVD